MTPYTLVRWYESLRRICYFNLQITGTCYPVFSVERLIPVHKTIQPDLRPT